MVDTDSESSHRALFVETNAVSDLPERTLYRVVTPPHQGEDGPCEEAG